MTRQSLRSAHRLGVRAERGRRFAELTSLRVDRLIAISPQTEAEAAAVVHELEQAGVGWRTGSGSNVLADDGEHHYVVLALKDLKGEVRFEGDLVHVSAGYSLPRLCIDVARQGLSESRGSVEFGNCRWGIVDECRRLWP